MVQKGLQKEKEKLENQQLKELNRKDPEEKIVFKLSRNLEGEIFYLIYFV